MSNKVLLIEDDLILSITLKDFFEDNGLQVIAVGTGKEGLSCYAAHKPDLILLDIILPDTNGFEVIAKIREIDLLTPAILMTGTEFTEANQIKAYKLGSLNFMPKPILPQAVLALIQYVLTLPKDVKNYKVGSCEIQIQSQLVIVNSIKHNVREKDGQLLQFLLERKGQIVAREVLLKQIWLDDYAKNNLLDGAILRLRRLFLAHPDVKISSIYANGYVIEVDSAQ